ncbi:MAG: hypothetical protein DRQ89_11895 [Epsilonproteobacteria bacterium]|nr:MAG: hypothetical protein DRQ89_11895 [Campylobacterota bacterium]
MKKFLLLLLIPLIGYARIIPKTSNNDNPSIGANSLVLYQYNSKEEKGIDLQELYLIFGGDIHPSFNSMIYISIAEETGGSYKIDPTTAIIRTTSWENFTLMSGRWFIDIGRHNPYFTFQFPFITQPELITKVFGPSALIGIGVALEWVLPTSWQSDLKLELTQVDNPTFFESDDDSYLGDIRWENSWDFSESNKFELALSYGRAEKRIDVWGADFKYSWHPDKKVLEWVGEYLAKDQVSGFYSHLRSEVFKNWWLQYRFDYTDTESIIKKHTALFAWVPSDKLAIRMQLDSINGNEESVLLQLNIGIGSFSENTY